MKISSLQLLNIILATVLVTSLFFISAESIGGNNELNTLECESEYDPWADINDDGIINYEDIYCLILKYMKSGTAINKTALLLELQSRVEALEAKFPITSDDLAADAIPYSTTHSTYWDYTSSESFVDMDDTSVVITLARTSTLLIMFSTEAWLSGSGTYPRIIIRAMIDGTQAHPQTDVLILMHLIEFSSHSFMFYYPNVGSGTHTVKIQWRVYNSATTANVGHRTLTVIALPA